MANASDTSPLKGISGLLRLCICLCTCLCILGVLVIAGGIFVLDGGAPTLSKPSMQADLALFLQTIPEATAVKPPISLPDIAFVNVQAMKESALPADTPDLPQTSFSDYRGTILVLNIWATWCTPCIAEMPALDRLQQRLLQEKVPIQVVTIALDTTPEPLYAFMETHAIHSLPILWDQAQSVLQALPTAGLPVRGIPLTLIVGPDGNVTASVAGEIDWNAEPVITALQALAGTA